MNVRFIGSVAVISPDAPASRGLYVNALGLPLTGEPEKKAHHGPFSFCRWAPRIANPRKSNTAL